MRIRVGQVWSRDKWPWLLSGWLLATNGGAETFSLANAWHLAPGERPYLTSHASLERGVAYNPHTDQVLLVSRVDSFTVRRMAVLNAADGSDAGELNFSGISGGTILLSKLGVADDGVIYAANFGTYTAANPFKVYRWANAGAAPTLAFSGDPGWGDSQQWGNALDVRGAGENTQILLATRGTVVAVLVTANGTNFTSAVLNTDAPAGAFYHGIAFGPGDTFWGTTNTGPLREMEFNLNLGVATTRRTVASAEVAFGLTALAVDPVNRLLAGILRGPPDRIALYDFSDPLQGLQLVETRAWPTAHANPLFQGALDFAANGQLVALNANNGLAAFRLVPPRRLAIHGDGPNVTLSWPARSRDVVVQTRSEPGENSDWNTRLLAAQLQEGAWRVTVPRTNTSAYYRLHRTVRVMSYNIQHGEGADGVIDLPRIAAVITNAAADIVALQEVDQRTTRSGGVDQAAELGRLTGMNHYFGRSINFQGGGYGNAVLSRFPIRQQKRTLLTRLNQTTEQRSVSEVVLDLGGTECVLLNTHLDAGAGHEERLQGVAQLKDIVAGRGDRPVLVCGDFNTRPTEPAYTTMAADLVDAWAVVGAGNGYSFPSTLPNRRIDYFWYPPGRQTPLRGWLPATLASDHLPLIFEWLVPGD